MAEVQAQREVKGELTNSGPMMEMSPVKMTRGNTAKESWRERMTWMREGGREGGREERMWC